MFHSDVQGHLDPTSQGDETTDHSTSLDIGPGQTQLTQGSSSRDIRRRKLALIRKLRNLKIEQLEHDKTNKAIVVTASL